MPHTYYNLEKGEQRMTVRVDHNGYWEWEIFGVWSELPKKYKDAIQVSIDKFCTSKTDFIGNNS